MRFSKIKDNDIANGIGITMSLWTQGCPHHCKGCFNGETWDFNSGKEFRKEDLDYILKNINKNSVQRDLSILGGEPLCPENVDGVIYDSNLLLVTYKKGKNNLVELMEYLKKESIKYNKIYSERPTLNDVFLELTGKELRD